MARALRAGIWRSTRAVNTLFMLMLAAVLLLQSSDDMVTVVIALVLIAVALLTFLLTLLIRSSKRSTERLAAPGSTLGIRFETECVTMLFATGAIRLRYSDFRKARPFKGFMVLYRKNNYMYYALPAQLFPPSFPADLQTLRRR